MESNQTTTRASPDTFKKHSRPCLLPFVCSFSALYPSKHPVNTVSGIDLSPTGARGRKRGSRTGAGVGVSSLLLPPQPCVRLRAPFPRVPVRSSFLCNATAPSYQQPSYHLHYYGTCLQRQRRHLEQGEGGGTVSAKPKLGGDPNHLADSGLCAEPFLQPPISTDAPENGLIARRSQFPCVDSSPPLPPSLF